MGSKPFPSDKIRNVAVVGHSSTGKTTLISAMLFDTKAVNRLGKVDKGNADDRLRRRSRSSARSPSGPRSHTPRTRLQDQPDRHAWLLDLHDRCRAGSQGRGVGAHAGVRCGRTRSADREAVEGLRRVESPGSCSSSTSWIGSVPRPPGRSQQLQKRFGREVVPVQLPIGEEHVVLGRRRPCAHDRVAVCGRRERCDREDRHPGRPQGRRPRPHAAALIEMVAEQDEALLEKFFAEGSLSNDELSRRTHQGSGRSAGSSRCTSAASGRNQGVQPILDALVDLVPNPVVGRVLAQEHRRRRRDGDTGPPTAMPIAYVFKTLSDPYAGRITLVRVFSGNLASDATYYNRTA